MSVIWRRGRGGGGGVWEYDRIIENSLDNANVMMIFVVVRLLSPRDLKKRTRTHFKCYVITG